MPGLSLRSRILLLTAVPTLVAALLMGSYLLLNRFHDIRSQSDQTQQLILESYAARSSILPADATEADALKILKALLEEQDVRAATLTMGSSPLVVHAGPRMRPASSDSQKKTDSLRTIGGGWQRAITIPGFADRTLEVEFSPERQHIEILQAMLVLLLTVLVIIGMTLITALHFSRKLTEPLSSFTGAIRRIRDGKLNTRLETRSPAELGELEHAINAMAIAMEESRTELQQNVDQATQDLRETLETIEIQNIELDMARKEALKASQIKSEFLANISHEIRTPLNGIIGFTRLLLKTEDAPRKRDYLNTIRRSSEALLAIINDILDLSKIEAGKLSLECIPLNLYDIIEDVQSMLAPLAQDKLLEQATIVYSDVPLRLLGDPLRIRQVLTNLVNNAIKFTDHGSVVVRAMLEEQRDHLATIKITITDTGHGIGNEMQKNLFSAFSQVDQSTARRTSGTGLGLAISKRLVEEMGGEIGVESTEGQGSVFWFTLRLEVDYHSPVEDSFRAFRGKQAIFAEANEAARLGLMHLLQSWGMAATMVEEVQSLPTVIAQFPKDLTPVLILALPPGDMPPEHQQLLHTLIQSETHALVVLASHVERVVETIGHQTDRCKVLPKPVSRIKLYDTLLELSGQHRHEQQAQTPQKKPEHQLHVMIVDDHPGNLKLAKVFLEEMGVDVTPCLSGAEAVDAFRKRPTDLIFMDIQMPGMDGLATTRAIRELEAKAGQLSRTPVVALTAHALASERARLLKAGMDDYLSKPVSEQQLQHILEKWTGVQISYHTAGLPTSAGPADRNGILDEPLALRRAGSRVALAQDMHQMLLASLQESVPVIRQALYEGNQELLKETLHRLKGATRYCGTPGLEEVVKDADATVRNSVDPGQIEPSISAVFDEIAKVIEESQHHTGIFAICSTAQTIRLRNRPDDAPKTGPEATTQSKPAV